MSSLPELFHYRRNNCVYYFIYVQDLLRDLFVHCWIRHVSYQTNYALQIFILHKSQVRYSNKDRNESKRKERM